MHIIYSSLHPPPHSRASPTLSCKIPTLPLIHENTSGGRSAPPMQENKAPKKKKTRREFHVVTPERAADGAAPKGVTNFSLDDSGKFEVRLDRACNAKFENELHYDMNVTGTLSYGQIDGLVGISAQDLFLWFPVIEIRVDIPSSGLIYFDVGVVSKQYSLSSFESPRDCLAAPAPDLREGKRIVESVSKIMSRKLRFELDKDNLGRTSL
ncbi:hypothetical protein MIMGU_mgv1a026495mg [Erythranthe guttata]|uniref:Uncharacterized protein n=1 Tax=Erythranthe guttata TaxID=4155 RepID=A0A022S198_ERYGU|nr:hypothetical protein MIMGU_mgv1a026495mg [Erythranthe guttata]